MNINVKVKYGLQVLIEIGASNSKIGIYQKDIAINQIISVKYLDFIIHELKAAGLITNYKGKSSGYILNKKSSEITINDVYRAFEDDINIVPCLYNKSSCDRANKCAARCFWSELNTRIITCLKKNTLKDIIRKRN